MNKKIFALLALTYLLLATISLSCSKQDSRNLIRQKNTNSRLSKKSSLIKDSHAVKKTIIKITNKGYFPNKLTIKAETKVVWTNESNKNAQPHDDAFTFQSYVLEKGDSFRHTFENPGVYSIHNHIGPGKMTITVK